MIFLHGGVPCPAELAALVAMLGVLPGMYWWVRCWLSERFKTNRCQYADCQYPEATENEPVTCHLCRDDLGLDPLGDHDDDHQE